MQNWKKNRNNRHKKKAFEAVCSLLRGVCHFVRSIRPNNNEIPFQVSGSGTGLTWTVFGRRGLQLPALALVVLPAMVSAQGFEKASWSSSGDFTLNNSFTSSSSWSRPSNEWTALDSFELSRPGRGPSPAPQIRIGTGSKIDRLLDVIAAAEAGSKGYDAIHYSATRLPAKPPSQMTIGEIFAWIRETPGQHHAIGRYQIIPSTLAYLVRVEGINSGAVYTPELQKRLAFRLMVDGGYHDFANGRLTRAQFQDRLAAIWAGLPLQNGRSKYHNTAGNRATITRANFDAAMAAIFGA